MKIEDFLAKVSEIARPLIPTYGYGVLSVILAQGLLECGIDNIEKETGLFPYNNFFGLKCGGAWTGKSINMNTQEEYTEGVLTDITDYFRVYNSFEEGIVGYFGFLNWWHYDNLKGLTNPQEYVQALKDDAYATSFHYVNNIMNVIDNFNLTHYDEEQEQPVQPVPEEQPEAPQESVSSYTVVAGDDLSQIAQDNNTTVDALVRINNIADANLIYAGQVIYLSDAGEQEEDTPMYENRSYTVQSGDCMSAIAHVYDSTVDAIAEANGIENVNLIYAGQVLTIPR